MAVEHPGVGVEDLTHGLARTHGSFAGFQRFDCRRVHAFLRVIGFTDDEGPHHGGVIPSVGTGPFQCHLIRHLERTAVRLVAAQQGGRARADDEFVAGVIATALEHGALHGRENIALEGSGAGGLECRVEGIIGERGGTAVELDLCWTLVAPQQAHQVGGLN